MTKIIHLLNPNQKMKLELILEGLDKIRIEYSKGNTDTDKLIEINRIIKEIKEYVPNHIFNWGGIMNIFYLLPHINLAKLNLKIKLMDLNKHMPYNEIVLISTKYNSHIYCSKGQAKEYIETAHKEYVNKIQPEFNI